MSAPPIDVLGMTGDEFRGAAAEIGLGPHKALETYRGFFREGRAPEVTRPAAPLGVVRRIGETVKFTQPVDGAPGGPALETESVILPQRSRTGRPRVALCVSSQVGCAMGCTFCETARMGLLADLSAAQIVGQWHAARFRLDARITNVVFMGMGEPMDNLGPVIQAIRVLAGRDGPAIAPSRIAVSTVGHTGGIRRLAAFAREPGFRQIRLAVSLNAPNDEIRSRIMPLNRAMPMAALREAMHEWPARRGRPLLVEYVLIPGVNDAAEHADELCRYLEPLECTVNVIPYNPRRDSPWPAPDEADVDRFVARVQATGRLVKRRRTMGRPVMAACGQLGNPQIRRRSDRASLTR